MLQYAYCDTKILSSRIANIHSIKHIIFSQPANIIHHELVSIQDDYIMIQEITKLTITIADRQQGMAIFLTLFIPVVLLSQTTASKTCLVNLIDVERATLNNDKNLQSLVRAFYPTDLFPPLWVKVVYYINGSVSNYSLARNDWSNSPVMVYLHPLLLEGISLYFLNIDYTSYQAKLEIPPFCNTLSEEDIIQILNDATVWVCNQCSVIYILCCLCMCSPVKLLSNY